MGETVRSEDERERVLLGGVFHPEGAQSWAKTGVASHTPDSHLRTIDFVDEWIVGTSGAIDPLALLGLGYVCLVLVLHKIRKREKNLEHLEPKANSILNNDLLCVCVLMSRATRLNRLKGEVLLALFSP